MRGSALVPLVLFIAACGAQASSPTNPANPTPTPTLLPTPAASMGLSGHIWVADENRIDPNTQLPVGYRLAPDGTEVAYRPMGTTAWRTTTTKDGVYQFEGVPRTRVELRAKSPGFGLRTLEWGPPHETLDFEWKNDACLYDAPELIAVSPSPTQRWDPSKPLTVTLRYSEELDPASFDPKEFSLSSTDIRGLSVTDGTALFGMSTRVTLKGDTVTLTTLAPLANLRGRRYPRVMLAYGKGTLREKTGGKLVESYCLDGKKSESAAAVPLTFWTDDSPPVLTRVTVRPNGQGYDLRMTFSEWMATMLNGEEASGSIDSRTLNPASYRLVASSSVPLELSDLAVDPRDPRTITATLEAPVSIREIRITPFNACDPAGNPASGSIQVRF